MDANQDKADTDRKNDRENLKGIIEDMRKEIKSGQEKIRREIKSGQTEMRAIIKAWSSDLKINREETMACQDTMEALLEEDKPASVDMTPEVAHEQEVPVEDATVMPVGEPRKRRRDRNLAAQRRQKMEQERTQRKDGCQKNLVAARRAAVAWRKINVFRKILTHGYCGLWKEVTAAGMKIGRCAEHRRKRQNKDDAERETRKGRTEETRRRKGPQCKTGIKDTTMTNIEGWNPGERAPLGS
jgi:hypothetical protein